MQYTFLDEVDLIGRSDNDGLAPRGVPLLFSAPMVLIGCGGEILARWNLPRVIVGRLL
jgi:hypothetical protein